MIRRLLAAILLFLVAGCATDPPIIEYTLARTSINAAKHYSASRYAPGYWHKAEQAYRKGRSLYKADKFEEAAEQFSKTRHFAEKAENLSRLERMKSGEAVP